MNGKGWAIVAAGAAVAGAALWVWLGGVDDSATPAPTAGVPVATVDASPDAATTPDPTTNPDQVLSAQDLETLRTDIEVVDPDGNIVTLRDAHNNMHTVPADSIYTRQDLVTELGWTSADILGQDSAFAVAAKFLGAATSTDYHDGGAASLAQSKQWAVGEALALVEQWQAAVEESGPSIAEAQAQEVTTSLVTLTWAPRNLSEQYGPTTTDRVVLLAHYQLRPSTAGAAISEQDTILVLDRTGAGWRVSQWPQVNLGAHDGEPGQGD